MSFEALGLHTSIDNAETAAGKEKPSPVQEEAVTAGSAPFSGCYQPETSFACYAGTSPTGTWQLKAADGASGDTGTINNWSLMFCVQ